MVSKRQKEARKRFAEANPRPEDATTSIPKAEKGTKKRKAGGGFWKKSGTSALRKHPLRVPGMRPGESCYICKSTGHIAKLCPEKALWERKKICLLCRQRGHSLKNCPESYGTNEKKMCYNCGEVGHSLSMCPLPIEDGGTKFAKCFICKEQGHLSKNCPKNAHGVYPKGGSCKICGEVTHLAKYCPSKRYTSLPTSTGEHKFLDDPDPSEDQQRSHKIHQSGDDLEDDFVEASTLQSKKNGDSSTNLASAIGMEDVTKNIREKTKKQGPKIVNFHG
ncbi:cellular nucleic acid-binding protein homolog [Zingiber officinale]|uniref:CCHC-type domain-containing protein n=1 Tax=Zingiber officinale TaxID=94328 RepID=A0A8J5KC78_ZINOF|nr:cellular nucleic acid-binding protein homolog [Zingiber officinale]KAG6483885.1 hypothetical protein ZIOFF_060671 [Zingiber officinale]